METAWVYVSLPFKKVNSFVSFFPETLSTTYTTVRWMLLTIFFFFREEDCEKGVNLDLHLI